MSHEVMTKNYCCLLFGQSCVDGIIVSTCLVTIIELLLTVFFGRREMK